MPTSQSSADIPVARALYVDQQYLSPYALSVFVALTELALPFELRTLDLGAGQQWGQAYAHSLTRRVPLLEESSPQGRWVLSESSAIAEYLQDTHPQAALYPRAARPKAQARQIQAWLRSDLLPIRAERPTEVVFGPATPRAPLSPAAQQAARKLLDAAQAWLGDGREHLLGAWCLADTDLALMLQRLILAGDAVPAILQTYAARQWQRPGVQAWLALPRPWPAHAA